MANIKTMRTLPITIIFVLTVMITLGVAGIVWTQQNGQSAAKAPQRFKVVTSFTIIADMAKNVAGDAADVESITRAGAEIHEYDPTPRDVARAQDADLILWNGLNLERWFERFLQDARDTPSAVVTAGIKPMAIAGGPYADKPNPHAWMSPDNALIYVDNIRAALVRHDPQNAAVYNANAAIYSDKIKALKQEMLAAARTLDPTQKWLVTSEGAFSYLARDWGFREAYLWPINADQQGSPQQMRAVIDIMRTHAIPVIFSESTVSDKPARQVARETGARYGGVLYVDSLSRADGPVPTYLDLLRSTTRTIIDGFSPESAGKHAAR